MARLRTKRFRILSVVFGGTLLLNLLPLGGVAGAEEPEPRVAIQAGHWRAGEAPLPLRLSTGSSIAGLDEWALNLIIAEHLADRLRAEGVTVEVLPSWFPANYQADVFVALHINASPNPAHRGFFTDRAEDSLIPEEEDRLAGLIDESLRAATPLPYIYRPTRASRRYYGYYRVTGDTPAVLVEAGFLTNADDRTFLVSSPEAVAQALADAIQEFLSGGHPASGRPRPAAPPRQGRIRVAWGNGAILRAQPTRRSAALALIPDRTEIVINGTQPGEQLDHGNGTWHTVTWQGYRGYVYADLVAAGN